MLKLEYLRYHYNLSDRQVIDRGSTDIAFRYFLQVDVGGVASGSQFAVSLSRSVGDERLPQSL